MTLTFTPSTACGVATAVVDSAAKLRPLSESLKRKLHHYGWRRDERIARKPPGQKPTGKSKGESAMTCRHATLPTIFVLILCFVCSASSGAWAQAGNITPAMQNNCANDYRKFCGDYGLQTSALNLCMKKAGPSLSPACVQALVAAGKVSQAEVDRVKAQMKGK